MGERARRVASWILLSMAIADVSASQNPSPAELLIDATGDGNGKVLAQPGPMALDSLGNVFVAGSTSDNVFKITPSGSITEIIDNGGNGPGRLFFPLGLAVDDNDNVYVTGYDSHTVFRIEPTGATTRLLWRDPEAPIELTQPRGIAVGPDGSVYVAGGGTDNVFRIEPGGGASEIIDASGDGLGNSLDRAYDVALDSVGNVYVTGYWSDNLFRVSPEGVVTEVIDPSGDGLGNTLRYPADLAVGPFGEVYVVSRGNGKLFKVTGEGGVSELMGDFDGWTLDGVVADAVGNVYVGSRSWESVLKIASDGSVGPVHDFICTEDYSACASQIRDVALDDYGSIYVTSGDNHTAFLLPEPSLASSLLSGFMSLNLMVLLRSRRRTSLSFWPPTAHRRAVD